MKKIFLSIILLGLFFAGGHTVFAQTTACPTGSDNECPGAQVCNPDTKQCMVDPQDGLNSIGDACTSDNQCRGNTVWCDPNAHVCAYDTGSTPTPVAGASTPAGSSAAGTPAAGSAAGATGGAAGSGNFVPLTNLPIFGNSSTLTSAPSLSAFFNALYLYCVGIAAVLAVLQLIHAGILYMGGDSVTEVKQAKDLIGSAILGLLLVLSPVIIFGLINPKILTLNVGFDKLGTTQTTAAPAAAPLPASAASVASCNNYGNLKVGLTASGCSAMSNIGYTQIDNSCCSTVPAGTVCCAQPNSQTGITAAPATQNRSITVTDFIYQALAGNGTDEGPIPSSASTFNTFAQSCSAAKLTLKPQYGSAGTCSAADIAATPKLKPFAGYIKCTPTTFYCN